jgi:hypothetical protein
MENISLLSTTGYYAFGDGDILYGSAMQGVRDKINELIRAFNSQFGNGDSSSGGEGSGGEGDSGSGNGSGAPYMYMASNMKYPYEDPDILRYNGDIYVPSTKTRLRAETLLGVIGVSDDYSPWWVYGTYGNASPNVINAAGRLRIETQETSDVDDFIQTWFRNPDFYKSQKNPGEYLGKDYIFDCSTEIYDTNYGIQCFMSNDNGWFTDDSNNTNIVTPTRVPTIYQVYNDPDVYGGYYKKAENYL